MQPSVSKRVQDYIREHTSKTTANFSAFEAAVTRAHELYDSMPAELRLRIFRDMKDNYRGDLRTHLFGIIDEEVSLLEAIRVTCGHKLHELVTGIWEGFSPQRFRGAVLSCRALYEEAASAKYYGDQAESAIKHLLLTPPTTYRSKRLEQKLRATNTEQLKVLLNDTLSPDKILRQWYCKRKIDFRKPFDDHELDKKDALYPGFFLRAFKTLKWQDEIPAAWFYALLCEATHPNMLSNTLYADDASQTDSEQLVYLIRKMPVTIEPHVTLYNFVSVPTVECVKIIDQYIQKIASLRSDLAQYVQKARRVTA
jgi:hypothetical protein